MKLTRRGSRANHGERWTRISNPRVEFVRNEGIELRAYGVPDFDTPAHHDFRVAIAEAELKEMVGEDICDKTIIARIDPLKRTKDYRRKSDKSAIDFRIAKRSEKLHSYCKI